MHYLPGLSKPASPAVAGETTLISRVLLESPVKNAPEWKGGRGQSQVPGAQGMGQHGGVPTSLGESSSGRVRFQHREPQGYHFQHCGSVTLAGCTHPNPKVRGWAFSKALWKPKQLRRDRHQSALGQERRESSFPRGCFPGESALGNGFHEHR